MAQIYAGILGPLAFLTCLARGAIHGGATESILWTAWCSLLVFAAVGCVIGWVAERTVANMVHDKISAQLAQSAPLEEEKAARSGVGGV